jgi:DNA-binding NarL/FixJ family response regulator
MRQRQPRFDAHHESLADTIPPRAESELLALFAEFLRARTAPDPQPARLDALSPREREVLDLIRSGLNNREIAARLCVEYGTVKRHVHNILCKLNARNRAEAVALAQRA